MDPVLPPERTGLAALDDWLLRVLPRRRLQILSVVLPLVYFTTTMQPSAQVSVDLTGNPALLLTGIVLLSVTMAWLSAFALLLRRWALGIVGNTRPTPAFDILLILLPAFAGALTGGCSCCTGWIILAAVGLMPPVTV